MRAFVMLLAAAGLSACGPEAEAPPPVVAAALTYDGADATDAKARLAHGERLASILSCKGCHAADLRGRNVTAGEAPVGDMYAPNLTLLLPTYSDAELDRAIRGGIAKDGRHLWFMPSETYSHLSDADFAALVSYLRTHRPGGKPQPPIRKGPAYLADIEKGIYTDGPGMVKRYAAEQPIDLGPDHAFGRYLAKTTCTECHNGKLQGFENFTPNLDMAGAYSAEELTRLLTTGEGKVKKDLGLMSSTSREAFAKLTPRERTALVAYVKARAEQPQ